MEIRAPVLQKAIRKRAQPFPGARVVSHPKRERSRLTSRNSGLANRPKEEYPPLKKTRYKGEPSSKLSAGKGRVGRKKDHRAVRGEEEEEGGGQGKVKDDLHKLSR